MPLARLSSLKPTHPRASPRQAARLCARTRAGVAQPAQAPAAKRRSRTWEPTPSRQSRSRRRMVCRRTGDRLVRTRQGPALPTLAARACAVKAAVKARVRLSRVTARVTLPPTMDTITRTMISAATAGASWAALPTLPARRGNCWAGGGMAKMGRRASKARRRRCTGN